MKKKVLNGWKRLRKAIKKSARPGETKHDPDRLHGTRSASMGSTEEHKPISGNLPVFLKTICAFTALIFAAAPEQHRDFRISVLSVANYDWSSYIASRLVFARSRSPAALVSLVACRACPA